MISGFPRNVNEIGTLLRCYTATTGSCWHFETNYWFCLWGSSSPRDVSNLLPIYAAQHHRRMKISTALIITAPSRRTLKGRGHTIPTSRELMWCYVCSWDVRGDLTLNSMAQIHTSVTLLTSRDLTWSSGRLMCQYASQISAAAHISWDVTYVSSALHTLPVVSRYGGNAYWKSAPTDLFIWHQVTRL